ncbi:hypothetical protein NEPAR04_0504 [Nematocida parisii]|nr:hypothetical protein NEPAR04_0504 [Nematocida parisii]
MGIILENDSVQDKQLGNAIIHYMDIPYFHNNTWYLSLWKRLHQLKQSSEILFLMRMKGIGLLSSWIYLELHEHFVKKGCKSCAHAVLIEGIKAQAHPIELLEEKVNYSIQKEHSLEKPDRIRLFGREWACIVEYMNLADLLQKESECIAYMEYRIIQHTRKRKKIDEEETEKGLNEVSLLFGRSKGRSSKDKDKEEKEPEVGDLSDFLVKRKKQDISDQNDAILESASPNQDTLEDAPRTTAAHNTPEPPFLCGVQEEGNKSLDINELSLPYTDNIQEVYTEAFTKIAEEQDKIATEDQGFLISSPPNQPEPAETLSKAINMDVLEGKNVLCRQQSILNDGSLFGNPMVGSKLVIKEMLYIVKKQLGGSSFLVTRIASLGDGNITLNARDYALQCIENVSEYSISKELEQTGHSVPIEVAVNYSDKLIALSAYKEMGSLDRAVHLITEKTGYISEILSAHYIKEILQIGIALHKIGYDISRCVLKDFVLAVDNGQISIRLAVYKNVRVGTAFTVDECKVFADILKNTRIENTQTLLTRTLPPAEWLLKLTSYTTQKKEAALLQSLFITQEVCIYEEAQLV